MELKKKTIRYINAGIEFIVYATGRFSDKCRKGLRIRVNNRDFRNLFRYSSTKESGKEASRQESRW